MQISELTADQMARLKDLVEEEMMVDIVLEDDVAFTRDTFAEFGQGWNRRGAVREGDGWKLFERAQVRKGGQRKDVGVLECGEFRAVVAI